MPHTQYPIPPVSSRQGAPALGRHLAKKQVFPNSCGAASLLCAAKELGVNKMVAYTGSMSAQIGVDTLELDCRCESDLYKITSGSTTQRQGQSSLHKAGYSMPDNIIIAGRLLGLTMRAEKDPGLLSAALAWIYPDMEKRLSEIGCPLEGKIRPANANEIRIEAMAVSLMGIPVGLHWVVHRYDGSYMDPATGKNQKDFLELNEGAKREVIRLVGYYQTGISIVATKDS